MGQITLTLPADGTTIDASDVNNPLNTLLNEFNGNIDDNNIKTGAAINAAKLNTNTLPPTVFDANSRAGWLTGILPVPNTVTHNGNRSYTCTFNSVDLTSYISNGMRLRFTRTVAAPSQCTSLNGTTQFYSKTSPAGMTFTNNFTVSAWVKASSYATGAIASRVDGTQGWQFYMASTGQLTMTGFNGGLGNGFSLTSYQSIPLNKWVHVTAQMDMTVTTNSATTNYIMIDGVDVPATCTRAGTNPTALVQAGNLNIGAANSATFFPGKIAQVAIYSAKVTQAAIQATISQGLVGTETSLISAYSFNNSINDLNTTSANNLTANGSAVATNADSPFAQAATAGSLEYGIVMANSFSTNTTLTVSVPEGSAIPTSGGVSAVSYSPHAYPYGFPGISNVLAEAIYLAPLSTTSTSIGTAIVGGQITAVLPANKRAKISVKVPSYQTTASAPVGGYIGILDNTTLLTTELGILTTSGNPMAGFNPTYKFYTGAGGAKTYNITASANNAGTHSLTGATNQIIYFTLELEQPL